MFQPTIYIETDQWGNDPRIIDVDFVDAYVNTVNLDDGLVVQTSADESLIAALKVADWLDGRAAAITAAIVSQT